MDTVIRAHCPDCQADGVYDCHDVVAFENDGRFTYSFPCEHCGEWVERKASERIVGLLVNAGCDLIVLSMEAELYDIRSWT